jgi:hypothetical protein
MACHQNAGQNDKFQILENVAKLKYLEMRVTYQNCVHEEITSRLNLGNACCHSVENLMPSSAI